MHRHTRWNLASILALTLSIAALVVALIAVPGFAAPSPQQQQSQTPGISPFPPMSPDRPNFGPQPLPELALGENNPGPILRQNQQQMKKDIDQLYSMVQDLKQQSDKTNSAQVLSLALVNKAKKIQDLAKKIGNLAKGS
jgi:hypothetical protein